ncbi:MAG: hypothetical protein VB079_01605 [Petrimonas sp.]|nr:hypothetical protein [Petrimonas sp.]
MLIGKTFNHLVVIPHLLVAVNKIGGGGVERDHPERILRGDLRKIIACFLGPVARQEEQDKDK